MENQYYYDNQYLAKINKINISQDIELTDYDIDYIQKRDKFTEDYINKLSQ